MPLYNSNWTYWPSYTCNLHPNSFTKLNFLRIPRISYIHYCSAISYPYVNAKLHSILPILIQSIDDYWSDLHIMMMAVIRSSMSRMGLFMPRSSLSFSMSMFWMTFLVSATMAMALYTALSWATWYSGSNCKILRDMLMKIDPLIAILWNILDSVNVMYMKLFVCFFFNFKVIFIQNC